LAKLMAFSNFSLVSGGGSVFFPSSLLTLDLPLRGPGA
jgi:hypothetical protein